VVGGEVFLDECMQLLGGGIAAGKVKLAQGFYDPGIKREGLGVGVGKEEDAVSNLGADAGQALELSQSDLAANPLTKEEQAKVIEAAIQKAAEKPTGELTKSDVEKRTKLYSNGTEITDAGLAELRIALPKCRRIIHFH